MSIWLSVNGESKGDFYFTLSIFFIYVLLIYLCDCVRMLTCVWVYTCMHKVFQS